MGVSGERETAERCFFSNYTLRLHNYYHNFIIIIIFHQNYTHAELTCGHWHKFKYTDTSTRIQAPASAVACSASHCKRASKTALCILFSWSLSCSNVSSHTRVNTRRRSARVVGSRSWSWGPEPARRRESSVGHFPLYNRSLFPL